MWSSFSAINLKGKLSGIMGKKGTLECFRIGKGAKVWPYMGQWKIIDSVVFFRVTFGNFKLTHEIFMNMHPFISMIF